ncbi:hypothetical protein, partial [Salmonella enterica]
MAQRRQHAFVQLHDVMRNQLFMTRYYSSVTKPVLTPLALMNPLM